MVSVSTTVALRHAVAVAKRVERRQSGRADRLCNGEAARATENGIGAVDWGTLQAGVIISIIPCIAIYVFLQKYYVSGLLSGAVK